MALDKIKRGDRWFVAAYQCGCNGRAFTLSPNRDCTEQFFLSSTHCRFFRPARDGERMVFEVPHHQAKFHRQIVGDEEFEAAKRQKRRSR